MTPARDRDGRGGVDEFGEIARLFRPLTRGAPEALGLADDAAVLSSPSGCDLVVTTDTIVESVHFLPETPPAVVAGKLLRVNLSDLAAKAAEPWGWFLNIAWPARYDLAARTAFAAGLDEAQSAFGLRLFGGDTVRSPGGLVATATLLGLTPRGAMVRRSGARAGDLLFVSGTIGDAGLGLGALTGESLDLSVRDLEALAARHERPDPRLQLRAALRGFASAAADVSDGLLADAGRIASASGLGVEVDLDAVPLSTAAARWIERALDPATSRLRLATAGDDYEVVCAVPSDQIAAFAAAASEGGVPVAQIGRFTAEPGVRAFWSGADVTPAKLGWTHD